MFDAVSTKSGFTFKSMGKSGHIHHVATEKEIEKDKGTVF